ncbi:MAG: hypothetical protein K2R98_00205 [Gemmataceae bacterium]|nr:hypothetical protein [Gemmataceae bacterium]
MADGTSKKLLELLDAEHPAALRRAAVLVLSEVGGRDKDVAEGLCALLDDADADLRIDVIAAVGKLRVERALAKLLERIKVGGAEAEAAAQSAAKLGARGIQGLRDLMGEVAPGLRRRIAGSLASGGTTTAETAAVETLLDSDPGVVEATVRSLMEKLPSLGDAQRRAVADRILELLKDKKKGRRSPVSEAALLRLLAGINDPRAESVFWDHVEPPHPIEMRAAALQALGQLPPPTSGAAIKKLLACAAERDFRIAAQALMILKELPVNAKALKDWLPLFAAGDVAARRFAIDKLGNHDTAEVAAGLVAQIRHQDRALRDAAIARLATLEHGREALTSELLQAGSSEDAWALARAQAPLVREYPKPLRTKLFHQACKYLESEDRRADAFLFLLREADAKDLRDRLEERGIALRQKKKYAEALVYLKLLGRDPACGETTRFELAACSLKVSAHELAAESRAADPAIQQFARLVHSHENDPFTYVQKASWLSPEDLFYVGFHFVEGMGAERDFGGNVLRLVLKKSAKTQMGKDAKRKLRSAGLD